MNGTGGHIRHGSVESQCPHQSAHCYGSSVTVCSTVTPCLAMLNQPRPGQSEVTCCHCLFSHTVLSLVRITVTTQVQWNLIQEKTDVHFAVTMPAVTSR